MSGASADRLPELAGASVETRASWLVASVALIILSFSYGAPLVTAVALKPIAAELGSSRSLPALAGSLAWLGSGLGGIAMGWLAERIGVRWTVMFGAVMMGAGLALSAAGGVWLLVFAHAFVVGLAGMGGINVPLMTHISRWFDRRRGTALALISSGQYVAGVVWPALFERAVAHFGWRHTMELFGALAVVAILPLAALFLRDAPKAAARAAPAEDTLRQAGVTAWNPGTAFALLCFAGFSCCVPMAMPQAHLVAFCSDVGITPAHGALMFSAAAGLRLRQPAVLGLALRQDRRPCLRPRRLGLPVCGTRRLPPHPGRGRPVHRRRLLRARLQRHRAGLRARHLRALPDEGSGMAPAGMVLLEPRGHGRGRLAGGCPLRLLRLLRAGLRRGGRLQYRQSLRDFAGDCPAPRRARPGAGGLKPRDEASSPGGDLSEVALI